MGTDTQRLQDYHECISREVLAAVAGFSVPHLHRMARARNDSNSLCLGVGKDGNDDTLI
jgi:hypothetical protein